MSFFFATEWKPGQGSPQSIIFLFSRKKNVLKMLFYSESGSPRDYPVPEILNKRLFISIELL